MRWRLAQRWRNAAIVACGTLTAVCAVALLALPAICYVGLTESIPGQHHDVMAGLFELSALDASWERTALRSMNELASAPTADHGAALAGIAKRLQVATQDGASPLLQHTLPDVMRAFSEKAEILGQFQKARAVSQSALREVLAMEAEMAKFVREAWRDALDRQRLVAVDNLVTQILADAQRYDLTSAESYRKNLESSVADLRSAATTLPESLDSATVRLAAHIDDLLRAKPTEQGHFDRVRFHNAGPRAATLIRDLRLEGEQHAAQRERYRIYLAAYFCALLLLSAYLAARLIRRELALRAHGAGAAPAAADEPAPIEPTSSKRSDPGGQG